MTVLALDLATSTGFAFAELEAYDFRTAIERVPGSNAPMPRSGAYAVPKAKRGNLGAFLDAFDTWLGETLAVVQPSVVVFEAPLLRGTTSIDTARKLMNLAGMVELACYRSEGVRRCFQANNATVRKHFIQRGNGKRAEIKALTIAECNARGWEVESDDEADALALLDYAMHCLAPRRAA